jgi:hypothetical protein
MASTDVPKQAGPILNMAQVLSDQYGLVMNIGQTLVGISNPTANSTDIKSYENGSGDMVIPFGGMAIGSAGPVNRTFYKYVKLSFAFLCDPQSMGMFDNWFNHFIMSISEKRNDTGATGTISLGLYDHDSGMGGHVFTGEAHESISGLSITTSLSISKVRYTARVTINLLGPVTGAIAGHDVTGTFSKPTSKGILIGNASLVLVDTKTGYMGPSPPPPYPWNNTFQYFDVKVEGQ